MDRALSTVLAPWRKPTARHDPAKIVLDLDLAVALALGGDCLADVTLLREHRLTDRRLSYSVGFTLCTRSPRCSATGQRSCSAAVPPPQRTTVEAPGAAVVGSLKCSAESPMRPRGRRAYRQPPGGCIGRPRPQRPGGTTTMTATISPASRQDVLTARLAALRAEREQTLTETIPSGGGDMADRATNVDGHVRLAMLEQRIATVEDELAASQQPSARSTKDGVAVGDVVTLDLGDGPESFLLGSVDEAGDSVDVITPSSPLGQALQGARVGSTVSYATRPNRTLYATVVAVS